MNRRKLLGIALGLLIVMAAILVPIGTVGPLSQGPDLPRSEQGLAGELTSADQAALLARSIAGTALDYPVPAEYLAAMGIGYNYEVPSISNYGYPRGAHGQNAPEAIVLHIAQGSCAGMRAWFARLEAGASTHFAICEDGSIDQYVEIEDAAYGQGIVNNPDPGTIAATWSTYGRSPNLLSVSIEIAGKCEDNRNITERPRQEASLRVLLGWLRDNVGVALDTYHVIAHADIDAINRPADPFCIFGGEEGFREWVGNLAPAGAGSGPSNITVSKQLIKLVGADAIYYVAGGLKIHIPNPDVFNALGFSWDAVEEVQASDPRWRLPTFMGVP